MHFDFSDLVEEEKQSKISVFSDDRFGCVKHVAEDGKLGWKCLHCKTAHKGGLNTTKALAHLLQSGGQSMAACEKVRDHQQLAMHKKLWSLRCSNKELNSVSRKGAHALVKDNHR